MSGSREQATVFLLGWEPFNAALLETIRDAASYRFLPALTFEEAVNPPYDIDGALETAERRIRESGYVPDAIVGYWDFPTSTLLPLLRRRFGLPGPGLEAVLRCEHKYWSRCEQARLLPDMVPKFGVFDPFQRATIQALDLDFPIWVKPVKAHSSHLGFKVHHRKELEAVAARIQDRIEVFAEPFDRVLQEADLPPHIVAVGGRWCIAEAIISRGRQCTLEGYVLDGDVKIYGVVDSIREGLHRSCFGRYQYPSQLPRRVIERMVKATRTVMRGLGFDQSPFNIEFYWDERTDAIRLLEINARISKSHCPLFHLVDGASHQQVMAAVALGRDPVFPHREGRFRIAGKFMIRHYADGVVRRVPSSAEIARVGERFPDMRLNVDVSPSQSLRHLSFQDSYSFELAQLFLGAQTQAELLSKFREVRRMLPFEVEPLAAEVEAS